MQQPTSGITVPLKYVTPLLEDLIALGSDLDRIWEQARVRTPLRAVRDGSAAALSAAEFTRLYRGCTEELERRACHREGMRPLGRPAVKMLCYSVLPCGDLREVIARVGEFLRAMEERGGEVGLEERDGLAFFSMHAARRYRDNAALVVDITGLYFYYQLFSWLVGRRIPLRDVAFAYDPPDRANPLLERFGRPPDFGAPANQLVFPAAFLDEATTRTSRELERIIDYFPFDLSVGTPASRPSGTGLRLLILDAIQHRHEVPTLETAAQLFHVSPATLRRRLRDRGTRYSEIRANCQREVAEQLLLKPELSVEEIAEHLGFGSDRAFRRAFAAWTGLSPSRFRQHRQRLQGHGGNPGPT